MNHSGILRRHGVIAAVLALIMAAAFFFADGLTPRSAGAKPADVNQQVEALTVANSRIDIFVLDHDMEDLQWAGALQDPLGANLAWSGWSQHGSFTRLDALLDVEEGEFTVVPATPVAPGWEVYGYRIIAGGGWSDCGFNTLDYTDAPTFEVTAANPDWVVCIAVMPEGGIPGSLLTVQFVAPSVPGFWAGKLDVPSGNNDPMLSDLINSVSFYGHWHNGKAGTYWTFPTNQPKPGLWTYGFYSFETDAYYPDCPTDPSVYEPSKTYVGLTEEKPHWAMCVMALDTIPDIRLTLKIDGPTGVDWQGTVSAVGLSATWADWGVDGTSNVGSRTDIDPITHVFHPGNPIAPGWSPLSYAVFESSSPNPTCPTDIQAYQKYAVVYVHPMHPAWAVCARVTQEVKAPGTYFNVRTNSQYGPTGWVDGPGNFDFSWFYLGIEAASASGWLDDVPYGSYSVIPDNPPLTGKVVAGFYRMETDDYSQFCPLDSESYSMDAGTVQVSPQHPIWTVCVLLVDTPEPEPEPVVPDPTPSPTSAVPFDVPNYDDPGMPGSATTPNPTDTPSPTATPTPTEVPESPTPADGPESTPTPDPAETPVPGGSSGNGGVAGVATPVAPNTGETWDSGSSQSPVLKAGIILLALGAIAIAAKQLPARRKR